MCLSTQSGVWKKEPFVLPAKPRKVNTLAATASHENVVVCSEDSLRLATRGDRAARLGLALLYAVAMMSHGGFTPGPRRSSRNRWLVHRCYTPRSLPTVGNRHGEPSGPPTTTRGYECSVMTTRAGDISRWHNAAPPHSRTHFSRHLRGTLRCCGSASSGCRAAIAFMYL